MKAVLVIAVSSLPLIASAGADESSALAEELMEAMEKTAALMTEAMSWDNMKDEYTAIYTDVFTEEELTGLVSFYKSPIGQKFVAKQPELMQRSMQISQKLMAGLMPKIKALKKETGEASVEDQE